MRLIDADEIIKRSHDVIIGNGTKHRCFDTTLIHEIPTVDAVQVIRCKECKYYRWEIDMCDEPHSTAHNIVHEDDYCSRAERKEE